MHISCPFPPICRGCIRTFYPPIIWRLLGLNTCTLKQYLMFIPMVDFPWLFWELSIAHLCWLCFLDNHKAGIFSQGAGEVWVNVPTIKALPNISLKEEGNPSFACSLLPIRDPCSLQSETSPQNCSGSPGPLQSFLHSYLYGPLDSRTETVGAGNQEW